MYLPSLIKICIISFYTVMFSFSSHILANTKVPLFTPPAEIKKTSTLVRNYSPYSLINQTEKSIKSIPIEGRLTRINYRLDPKFTSHNLINNYLNQINSLGGKVIFSCRDNACGKASKLENLLKPIDNNGKDNPVLVTAKITLDNRELFTSIYISSWKKATNIQLDTIEVIEEPLDIIAIDKDYLQAEVSEITVKDNSNKDKRGASDHPMLTRIPGAYIQDYKTFQFGQTTVASGKVGKKFTTEVIEGKITDIAYKLPRSYSEYEVDANYQAALKKLGFIETFSCIAKACGTDSKFQRNFNALATNGTTESQFYRFYLLQKPTGNVYAMTYVIGYINGLSSELRIIEENTLNTDRLTIDLDGLTDKIAQNGHVALDGLLFEFDSDKLMPEAMDVVKVVAEYLKSHPKQQFYVVGHTDDQGGQSYNKVLSEKRAKAVRSALINDFNIKPTQVESTGLGEYAPVASNMNNAGKKQNRRVELVLRSDSK
ncbi:OmpA family protein [Shewanella sp. MMG014]|uniref:OmpA family protein n=1 Tax=Shewanella sp. MMG014 TaxID=2822691 RepID=UPI001B396A5E|nr:OmpA family protein [Shewanella sp. MMG014]MBQ4889563.1 OmpA family protein [Shewanella sp. MMG014]